MVVIVNPCMIRMLNIGLCDLLLCNGCIGNIGDHTGPGSGKVLDTGMDLRFW